MFGDRLGRLAPARRRQVLALLVVAVVIVVAGAAWLVASRASAPSADQGTPGPVVVIPGYGGSTESLGPLVDHLRARGRQVVVFRPTDGNRGDMRVQARRLADLVTTTLKSSGARSVDLVGYSAGGVIARLYVREDDGAGVVRRVLTIGSPQHGTDVAVLAQEVAGGCPTACEQLATGSDLLRVLDSGDETPAGPAWATVRSDADQVVTPTDSAVLAGAVNVRVQQRCPGRRTSHGDLPGDPVTLATLDSTLGAAAPAAPGRVSCG